MLASKGRRAGWVTPGGKTGGEERVREDRLSQSDTPVRRGVPSVVDRNQESGEPAPVGYTQAVVPAWWYQPGVHAIPTPEGGGTRYRGRNRTAALPTPPPLPRSAIASPWPPAPPAPLAPLRSHCSPPAPGGAGSPPPLSHRASAPPGHDPSPASRADAGGLAPARGQPGARAGPRRRLHGSDGLRGGYRASEGPADACRRSSRLSTARCAGAMPRRKASGAARHGPSATLQRRAHRLAQVHPPTGVTHCSAAFFTHVEPRGRSHTHVLPNLVVARSTLLQIFTVRCELSQPRACYHWWIVLVLYGWSELARLT